MIKPERVFILSWGLFADVTHGCHLGGLIVMLTIDHLFSSYVAVILGTHSGISFSVSKASYEKLGICNHRLRRQYLQNIPFLQL